MVCGKPINLASVSVLVIVMILGVSERLVEFDQFHIVLAECCVLEKGTKYSCFICLSLLFSADADI